MSTMPDPRRANYYILDSQSPRRMLLFEPPNPSRKDRWFAGRRFAAPPKEPIVVRIRPGHERGELLPFFGVATLMSDVFCAALREAGVDNIDTYDAVIQSEDGSTVHEGYKAFNLVGLVRAADLGKTVFSDPSGSRLIDASIESLTVDADKAGDLLMFRLAEYVGAVLVHEKVKKFIEAKNFPHVVFREPADLIS